MDMGAVEKALNSGNHYEDTWRRANGDNNPLLLFRYNKPLKVEIQFFKGDNSEGTLYFTPNHTEQKPNVDHVTIANNGQWITLPKAVDYLAFGSGEIKGEPDAGRIRFHP